jgi:ClpA/ClpB-like protein
VTEAILAGAVAGAIAGAITAAAIVLISSRRAPQPGRWRSFTTRSASPSSAFEPPHAGGRVTGPFDRFDDRAKRVLALAQDESIRMNHNYIGTEHLLLGLIREGEGVAARVLFSLGIDLTKVRKGVEYIVGRGEAATSPSEITLSPRTKKIIELAIDEARKLGTLHVGPEHLLLALVREGEGIAAGIIESLGVSGEQVRERVLATLREPRPPSP